MGLLGGRSNPSRRGSAHHLVAAAAALATVAGVWLAASRAGAPPLRASPPPFAADARGTDAPRALGGAPLPAAAGAPGLRGAERIAVPGTAGGSPEALASGPLSPGFDLRRIVDQVHFAFRAEGGVWSARHATHAARVADGALELTPYPPARATPRAGAAASARPDARAPGAALEGTPVRFGAATLARGGLLLASGEGVPSPTADGQLDLRKGAVVEELRNSAAGVEQRWAFAERPAGQGDVEVRVPVTGGTYLDATEGGLHFSAGRLGVRYGHGTWVDGLGVRTAVPARWDADAIVLRIPSAAIDGSTYPAVLDPTISPEIAIDEPVYASAYASIFAPAVAWNGIDYLVVWQDDRNGTHDVFGARVTEAGALRDPGGIAISTVGLDQRTPRVAANGTEFFVVWEDDRNGQDIYGARVTADGVVRDPDGIAISTAGEGEWEPDVASSAGTILVAWTAQAGAETRIRAALGTPSGGALAFADPVAVTTTWTGAPAVAAGPSGYLLTWHNGINANLRAARVATDGAIQDIGGFLVNASGLYPAVTWAGTEWFVVWGSYPANGVRGARISPDGVVTDPTGFDVWQYTEPEGTPTPSVAWIGSVAYVTWSVYVPSGYSYYANSGAFSLVTRLPIPGSNLGTDLTPFPVRVAAGSSGGLVVRDARWRVDAFAVTAAGDPLPATTVSVRANVEVDPAVAFDGTNYLVVWWDGRVPGGIYGARVSASGEVLDPAGLRISAFSDDARPSVAWSAGAARYLVAWENRTSSREVDGALVTAAGAVGARLRIAGFSLGNVAGVDVASNGAGFLVVAGLHYLDATSDVMGARVTGAGATPDYAAPLQIGMGGGSQDHPAVASDGTDYLVVYEDSRSGDMNIIGARVRASDGTILDGGLGVPVSTTLGGQAMAAVAFGASDYLAVWMDNRTGNAANIYGARVRPDGSTYPAESNGIPISVGAPGYTALDPEVTWDGQEWIVVWREKPSTSSPWLIRGTAVSAAGELLDPDGFFVGTCDHLGDVRPGLAAAGIGSFLVARDKAGMGPGLDVSRVFARRVSNAAPVANGQAISTGEDTPRVVTLTASDADGDPLAYAIGATPAHGVLTGTPPVVTYTPQANYAGPDTFTFRVGDGMAFSSFATVTVTVDAVNDAPVANGLAVATAEDAPLAITLGGSDVEGTALTYAVATPPAHGTLAGTPPDVTYTPAPDYFGPDAFTFTVTDSGTPLPALTSAPATVAITVTSVNDAPVAQAQAVATDEDTPLGVTVSASDVDGDPVAYVLVSAPAHGQLTWTPPAVTYRPDANFVGQDSFVFKANDGRLDSNFATVTITVNPVNDPPVATPLAVSTPEDTPVGFTVAGTDLEQDPLGFTTVTVPVHGTVTLLGPGIFLYVPAANYSGLDAFQFVASDGNGGVSAPATVTIVVTAVNDAPVATPLAVGTAEDSAVSITLAGTDVEGTALGYAVLTLPAHGTLSGTPPALVYTPAPDFAGADAFTYKVTDSGAPLPALDSAPATVSITVTPLNDAPTATARTVTVVEDTPGTFLLEGTDPDGDVLAVELATGPEHGTLAQSGATITYTPTLDYHGPDAFTFRVRDPGGLLSPEAAVSVTVTPANDAPVALPLAFALDEDAGPTDIVVSATDVDGDGLGYFLASSPSHGTVSVAGNVFTYTPALNFNGADAFTFKAFDGQLESVAATVSIWVYAVNDAPVATPLALFTNEDAPASVTLAGTDVDGDALSFELASLPAHGQLVQAGATILYSPDPNYAGTDAFTFRARDPFNASSEATVSIQVTGVNDAPVAFARSIAIPEDSGPTDVLVSGADFDGDPLTYLLVTPPAHGTITVSGATFTYTPAANYTGPDSFTFRSYDSHVQSDVPATVSIDVTPVNDAPAATPQARSTLEDTSLSITLAGADVDGDGLAFAVLASPAHGTLSGSAPDLTYLPDPNYVGTDAFTFRARDPGGLWSAPATVSLTVAAVNDAPVALAQAVTVAEDSGPTVITVAGSDVDGDALGYALVVQPSHGSVTANGAAFTYTPARDYHGPDAFTFRVADGQAESAVPATVSITVTAVNDAPVALPQALATYEDAPGSATLAGTDVDGDPLTFAIAAQPAHGTVTLSGATATYTPAASWFGADAFTFVASDGVAQSAPATVSVTVNPVNDAPLATAQAVTTAEDTPVAITLAGADLEGSVLSYALVTSPLHGTLTGAGASLVYTPAANFAGTDAFTFRVNDGSLDSQPATVSITVTPAADPPVAVSQAQTVAEDSVLPVTLAATDPDGDPLTYRIVTQPAHGRLDGTPPSVTYTPDANYHGPDAFAFVASDGGADSAPATVSITVASVNDAPVAVAKSATVAQGGAVTIVLEGTDVDGQALTYAIVSSPGHGALSGTAPELVYRPSAGFAGADSFTYRVDDGTVSSAAVTVSVTVVGPGAGAGEGTESVLGCTSGGGRGGGAGALLLGGLALWLAGPRRGRRRVGSVGLVLALALAAPAPASAGQEVPLPPPPTGPAPSKAPAAPPAAKGMRAAIMPIRAGLGIEPKMADLVTDALVAELTDRGLKTITSKDVEAALGFERQKQLLGCSSDTSCLAEIAGALGADRVVFGDISMVRELTVFSVQVFNVRSGAVERRFHERMTGGDAQDLLDATERAGAELFPGTTRSGTASRRKSVLTGTDRPFSLVLRGGVDVQDPGGLAVALAEYRLSRSVRLAAGGAMGGSDAFGGAIRAGWYPLVFSRVSIFASVEMILLVPGDAVFAVAPGLGLEVALSQRFVLSAEAPLLLLASAPKQYRKTYFVPSLAVGYRF